MATVKWRRSTVSHTRAKRECGAERKFQGRSCPRNCKRRARATLPLGPPGKAVTGGDPRARRPAVDSVVARAGCLGAGRVASAPASGRSPLRSGTGDHCPTARRDRSRSAHRRCDRLRVHHLPTSRRTGERTTPRCNLGRGDGQSRRRQRRRDQASAVLGELHARLECRRALQWLLDLCLRGPRCRLRAGEHVGPAAIAAHGGAQAARAIRQAADWFDHDAAAFGSFRRRRGQDCTGARFALRSTGMSAGDAHVDGGSVGGRCWIGHALLSDGGHPCRSAGAIAPTRVLMRFDRPRGTPPGPRPNQRQVSRLAGRRPSPPSRVVPVAMWHGLAAYSCGGSCGLGTFVPHRIPCSLSRERPSIAVT